MSNKIELSLSRERVAQLLDGEEVYEVISGRAYYYRINATYPLYKIPDTYVKILSNGMYNCRHIPYSIWDKLNPRASKEEFITERCGSMAWEMNSRVCVLRLVMVHEPNNKRLREKKFRKAWIRSDKPRGLFLSKDFLFPIDCEIAVSEPYCLISDRLGEWYRNMLCKEYGITMSELPKLSGWTNRKHTMSNLLPRRARVISSKVCNAREISEQDWELLGIGDNEDERKAIVGIDHWNGNMPIGLYEYELITDNVFNIKEKEVSDGK